MERSNNNLEPKPSPSPIPIPPPLNPNPHQHPNPERATSKPVQFKGAWVKKTKDSEKKKEKKKEEERIGYGVEITHRSITMPRGKIWIGTFNTPEEGAVAYDLASIQIKGKVPNKTIGDNQEILISMRGEIQKSIKRRVESKIMGHFRSGNGSNQAGRNRANKKKAVHRANDGASTSGSGARMGVWEAKKQ